MNKGNDTRTKGDLDKIWNRLSNYQFDEPGTSLTFAKRLARENGWAFDQAKHAVEEYKKFLFLAVAAGHPVTPSDQVDQVWHLHLSYTRDYWEKLCGKTLQMSLHHEPSRGGADEYKKYNRCYQKTLNSYKTVFGEEPPSDMWPSAEIRFGEAPYFQRINTLSHLIISKMSLYSSGLFLGFAALLSCAVSGNEQALKDEENGRSFLQDTGQLIWETCNDNPISTILIVGVVWFVATTSRRSNGRGGGCGSGCGGCGGCGGD